MYNSKNVVRTRYFFVCAAPSIAWKMYRIARGTIPRWSPYPPYIVCVLPVPVWPYAKIVPLYPYNTDSIIGRAVSSKIDYCLHVGAKTESNVKSRTLGRLDFSGLGFFTAILRSFSKTWTTISWLAYLYFKFGGRQRTTTFTVYVFDEALIFGGIY